VFTKFGPSHGPTTKQMIMLVHIKGINTTINSAGKNWSKIGHIVEDMQYLLRNFTQWKVDVVSRDANNAAHTLVKLAASHGENRTWLGVRPECICEIVLAEQSTSRD
jgi:hypothetical protein